MQITAKIDGKEVCRSANTPQEVWQRRDAINQMANTLIKKISSGELEEGEFLVKHRFAPGIYIREIFMPEDSLIVGKIHKTEHFNEIISGECKVVTPETGEVKHYKAGDIFVSAAGVQKAVYNITDVVWRTVHSNPTNTEDMAELESICIAEDYQSLPRDQLIEECKRLCL